MKKIPKYRNKPGKPGEFERFNEQTQQWEPTQFDGSGKPQNISASDRQEILEAHGAKVADSNRETNTGSDSALVEAGRTLGLNEQEAKLFAERETARSTEDF